MSILSDIGNLMCLPIDQIDPGKGIEVAKFLITASAEALNKQGGRNWIPVIVKETGEDSYEVIGNSFIYAVAQEAGLERVWCIIADSSQETAELTQILAREKVPKINLSTASRDEIMVALQYLIEKPDSQLKRVNLLVTTTRIEEAPRQYWKDFNPIANLKCGITRGKKLEALKEVFYLTPQPLPDVIKDSAILKAMTSSELKAMAKKRGVPKYSKMKKADLVKALSK